MNKKREHALNVGAGALHRLNKIGTTILKGVASGTGYVAKRATGSDLVGKALKSSVARMDAKRESDYGVRSRTTAGQIGQEAVGLFVPAGAAMKGFRVARALQKLVKTTKYSGAGKMGAQTKKYNLPRRSGR